MKKKIASLALVLVIAMSMTVGASAAYIPDDVTYQNLNGQQLAIKTYTLLPGSSQELCYLEGAALLAPQELAGGETLRLGTATLKFVPFCGSDFSW